MTNTEALNKIKDTLKEVNLRPNPLEKDVVSISWLASPYDIISLCEAIVEAEMNEETFTFFHELSLEDRLKLYSILIYVPKKEYEDILIISEVTFMSLVLTYKLPCKVFSLEIEGKPTNYVSSCLHHLGFYIDEETLKKYHKESHVFLELVISDFTIGDVVTEVFNSPIIPN